MLGYMGAVLLMIGYMFYAMKKEKIFIVINIIASAILTMHAILIDDIPFTIVNGFITLMLIRRAIDVFDLTPIFVKTGN